MKVALTGHRPERLGYSKDTYITTDWVFLINWIKDVIVKNGVTDVYCGMASGCDIAFGIAAYLLKNENYHIILHCILPCKDYNISHRWYQKLKEIADEWVELSEEFYKGCDNVRDQYMVDHCDKLIAVWDGNKTGGVWSTIRKAKKQGKEIIYYLKEKL